MFRANARVLRELINFIFRKLSSENKVKDNLIAFLNAVLDRKNRDRLVIDKNYLRLISSFRNYSFPPGFI